MTEEELCEKALAWVTWQADGEWPVQPDTARRYAMIRGFILGRLGPEVYAAMRRRVGEHRTGPGPTPEWDRTPERFEVEDLIRAVFPDVAREVRMWL